MSFFFINDPAITSAGLLNDFNNSKATCTLARTSNYFPRYFNVLVSGAATTLTVDNIMKGRLARSFTGTNVSDTLPTAAQIVAEMKSRHPLGNSMPNNTGFEFFVYYQPSSTGNYSFIPSTGVSVFGENSLHEFKACIVLVVATNVASGSESVIFTWLPGEE